MFINIIKYEKSVETIGEYAFTYTKFNGKNFHLYSGCFIGKHYIIKTNKNFFVVINNSKCIKKKVN